MSTFTTPEQIVEHILATWPPEDKEFVLSQGNDPYGIVCRQIRNEYGLWNDSPLTEKWRTDVAGRDIRNGIDFTLDHPDNMSATIFEMLVARLKEA